MNNIATPTVLIVPGLRDHMPGHWQTHLEQKLPNAISVPRMEHDKLSCAAWVRKLDESLAAIEGPVILVAHSAGVMIVVHWAQQHRRPIAGALLAAPPDFESPLPRRYPTGGCPPRERVAADAARAIAVSDHRRREYQRSARSLRAHRVARASVGQQARQPGQRRAPQPGVGVWRVAAGGSAHRRACERAHDLGMNRRRARPYVHRS